MHKLFDNVFITNEVKDQFDSHLALEQFCTPDDSLQGTPGMTRSIHRYTASSGAERLEMGQGNTKSIQVDMKSEDYKIQLAQSVLKVYDEQIMTDPYVMTTGTARLGADLFNETNKDVYKEFGKAKLTVFGKKFDFELFADAQAQLGFENLEGTSIFAIVHPNDLAELRQNLKETLQYVTEFATQGYVGTVAGVNIYVKKNATKGTIYLGTKEAVTLFVKKGEEVEEKRDADKRLTEIYARKFYLAALTDETKLVKMVKGSAKATTDTTVTSGKTYFEQVGTGYLTVVPEEGASPKDKGYFELA